MYNIVNGTPDVLHNFQIFFLNVTNIKLRYATSVSVMPLCRNLKYFALLGL